MRQPKTRQLWPLIAGLATALASPAARAQQAGAAPDEPKTLRELIDASIRWYDVFPDADAKQPAEVLTALRWANNTRGSEDGVTLLFVHGGRPLATCCVYPWAGRLEHGFGSLSRGTPIPPGLEPAAVEDGKQQGEVPKAKQNKENKEQTP